MARPAKPPTRPEPTQAPPTPAPISGRHASVPGPVEKAVRDDVEQLGDLVGVEPSLSELAYTLAREIDSGGGEEGRQLPQLTRELRQTLAQLLEGRAADDDDDLGDLASPD